MGYIISIFPALYGPYGPYITQHTRKYGPHGPYIAEIIRKYGPWGPYIAQHIGKLPKIGKPMFLHKKNNIFKCPYLQFPCVQNPKSGKNPNISKIEQKNKKISNNHKERMHPRTTDPKQLVVNET